MYTIYTTNLISENCPPNMNPDTCPLRKFVKSGSSLWHVTVNDTHLIPSDEKEETFIQMYKEMHAICKKCKTDNKQKIK